MEINNSLYRNNDMQVAPLISRGDIVHLDNDAPRLSREMEKIRTELSLVRKEYNMKQAKMQQHIEELEDTLEALHTKKNNRVIIIYFFKYLDKILRILFGLIPLSQRSKNCLKEIYFKRTYPLRVQPVSVSRRMKKLNPVLESVQKNDREDVFFWGVVDWHFRIQRPQHLAKQFSEIDHRVFYFSNEFIDDYSPGFKVEKLDAKHELYCIHLHVAGSVKIYHSKAPAFALQQLKESMKRFYQWSQTRSSFSIVQHPFWLDLVETLPNQALIYDCMDHHAGFENNIPEITVLEEKLVRQSDMLIVTSQWLYQEMLPKNSKAALIRNACDFEHFSNQPLSVFKDEKNRKIIGYYGAIAEWFDVELVEKIATEFSDCLILLIGNDTAKVGASLMKYANVLMTGEMNYQDLPYYLYAMDVCLIPFKVIPLTLATNPVKAYEYLSAGKSVVSVDLPELHEFYNTVLLANSHEEFISKIKICVVNPPSQQEKSRRIEFAKSQTWSHRVDAMRAVMKAQAYPLISIVIVTYNNLTYTKACLESIEIFTEYPNYEVIIVDNNSTDGSQAFLQDFTISKKHYSLILNQDNLGFAAANNQGLRIAKGEYMVLLNNDTYVTTGWLGTLYRYFKRYPALGLLGPITNNIGNEARVNVQYGNMTEMAEKTKEMTLKKMGHGFLIPVVAFFCTMMSRKAYEEIGELDEDFGIGMFEDDDYCQRAKQAGYQIRCADDVFIHHHLSASFDQMGVQRKQQLFEKNKIIYEKKWGAWSPHKYRDSDSI